MDKPSIAATLLGLAIAAMAPIAGARASELKILAGGSMTASLKELGPRFEKATGHKLEITFAATPELIKMATSAPFDLGVVPVDVVKNDGARAKFRALPRISRASAMASLSRRAHPSRTSSTPESLKATLLKAQSIAVFRQAQRAPTCRRPSSGSASPSR